MFASRMMMRAAISNCRSYQDLCIATLSCDILCDVLITFGMVYTLLSNRTQVRRYVRIKHCKNAITLFTPVSR